MIPILYEASEIEFLNDGIGRLADSKTCKVTEERNGEYELKLTYPVGGKFFNEIQNERLIVAKPFKNGKKQAFRIYSITDDLDGNIEVLANHISYDANFIPVSNFTATGITLTISGLSAHCLIPNNFTITNDGVTNETSRYDQIRPRSLRACLGGQEGSLLDVFSGQGTCDYEWDNYNAILHKHRGSDKGYVIRYAKNLSEYDRERDSTEVITGCIAYHYDEEDDEVIRRSDIMYNSLHGVYPIDKIATVDATEDFEITPNLEELNTYAQAYANSAVTLKESIDVSFYDIGDQDINLCDTVTVKYSLVTNEGAASVINYKAKVIKTVWDVLLDRYETITVGDARSTLGDTIEGQIEKASITAQEAVNHKIVSVVNYVDDQIGEVVSSVTALDERINGVDQTLSEQGTAIQQNATAIVSTARDLENSIKLHNAVNLQPFLGHPITDIYNPIDNPEGYWYMVSNVVNYKDGWGIVTLDNTSGEDMWVQFYALADTRFQDDKYMLLVEIADCALVGGDVRFWTLESLSYNSQYVGDISISAIADGVYRIPISKTGHSNPRVLIRTGLTFPSGVSGSFKIRVSMYKEGYEGEYLPYIADNLYLEDSFSTLTRSNQESSSRIDQLSNQITSTVSEISRVEGSIADVAGNVAAGLISESATTLSTQITQTATSINATISEVRNDVSANSNSIDEMHTYFTFAQDGLTVGKSDSDIRGVFGNNALEFVDKQNNTLAWLSTTEGLGADQLSVGSTTESAKRWKIVTDYSGNTLRFTRHS